MPALSKDRAGRPVEHWVNGVMRKAPDRTFTYLGEEPPRGADMRWSFFACLFPAAPHYRLYSTYEYTRDQWKEIRQEVLGLRLPKGVRRTYDATAASKGWRKSGELAGQLGIPVAVYLKGSFLPRGGVAATDLRPTTALCVSKLVPTAQMFERLVEAAKTARP